MITARELLDEKGRDLWSVGAEDSVYRALEIMAEKNVGALTVHSEGSQLAGIISERDYTRKIILLDRASKSTLVSEIMTADVIVAPDDTPIEKCMALMTRRKIRHLPIISNGAPAGMITLGDIMKTIIKEQSMTIEELESFIHEDQGGEG